MRFRKRSRIASSPRHWRGWQPIARPAAKATISLSPCTIDHLRIDDPKLGAILATQALLHTAGDKRAQPHGQEAVTVTSASGQAKYASTASTVPGP